MTDPIIIDGASYISAQEAAKLSGFTRDYIGKLCRDGKLEGRQIGGRWHVPESALSAFLVAHEYEKTHRGEVLATERVREYHRGQEKTLVFRKNSTIRPKSTRPEQAEGESLHDPHTPGDTIRAKLRTAVAMGATGSRAVAAHLSQAPSGITDASLQLAAHTPIHVITPVAELIQRTIALSIALVVTFGGFVLVAGIHTGSLPSMQIASPAPVIRDGAEWFSRAVSIEYETGSVTVEVVEESSRNAK